jgi:hypothetical protein
MSSVAIFVTATSLALAPPVDLKLTPASLARASLIASRGEALCGPRFDPQFVRYVPGATSQARDGLFRLISNPDHGASRTEASAQGLAGPSNCHQTLLTSYAPRP